MLMTKSMTFEPLTSTERLSTVSSPYMVFEMSFWYLEIDQKNNEIVARIFALASKKRSNQKSKGTLYH
jgi:hypothetical protein